MADKLNSKKAVSLEIDAEQFQEVGNRSLTKNTKIFSSVVLVIWAFYQTVMALGVISIMPGAHRAIHLMFGTFLALIFYQGTVKKKETSTKIQWYDTVLIVMSMVIAGYVFWYFEIDKANLAVKTGTITTVEMIMAVILVIITLESTRRILGLVLPALALGSLVYALYANVFPGFLHGRGVSLERLLSYLYLSGTGIYGQIVGVSANQVFPFVLFAAFFALSGAGKMFVDLSMAIFGKYRGGPAKVSVVASGFFGSISGSSVSNVMTTGAFTIPLMKKVGLSADFAGAVEAAASTGGTFMPPFMGAAAFIMADFLRIPYGEIIAAAAIPAILYYWALYSSIDLRARKMGLGGFEDNETLPAKDILKSGWYLLLPIILLIYLLVFRNFPPQRAAIWGIGAVLVVSSFNQQTRFNIKKLYKALEIGARNSIQIVVAVGTVSILTAIIQLTGLGVNLSQGLISLSGGFLPVLLILTMIASIILGMGLTASACYITLAILVAPSLVKLGVDPLAAHMFLFIFGNISFITPPVAISAYAAASLAGGNIMKTGYIAFRLGITAFIIPFMFIYGPQLLAKGSLVEIVVAFLTAVLGVWALSVGSEGFLFKELFLWERLPYIVGAFFLIVPRWELSLIGSGILLAAVLLHYYVLPVPHKEYSLKGGAKEV